MNVAQARAHQIDVAGRYAMLAGLDQSRCGAGGGVLLAAFGATHHPDHAPYRVVVQRRRLARPPNEADQRESLEGIAIEEVLLVPVGARPREHVRQPVVMGDQVGQQGLRLM